MIVEISEEEFYSKETFEPTTEDRIALPGEEEKATFPIIGEEKIPSASLQPIAGKEVDPEKLAKTIRGLGLAASVAAGLATGGLTSVLVPAAILGTGEAVASAVEGKPLKESIYSGATTGAIDAIVSRATLGLLKHAPSINTIINKTPGSKIAKEVYDSSLDFLSKTVGGKDLKIFKQAFKALDEGIDVFEVSGRKQLIIDTLKGVKSPKLQKFKKLAEVIEVSDNIGKDVNSFFKKAIKSEKSVKIKNAFKKLEKKIIEKADLIEVGKNFEKMSSSAVEKFAGKLGPSAIALLSGGGIKGGIGAFIVSSILSSNRFQKNMLKGATSKLGEFARKQVAKKGKLLLRGAAKTPQKAIALSLADIPNDILGELAEKSLEEISNSKKSLIRKTEK